MGPFFANYAIWVLRRYFLGWGQVQKLFLGPTYIDCLLLFWKYSQIFAFCFGPIWGLFYSFLVPTGLIDGPFETIFGFGSGLQTFLGTKIEAITFGFRSVALSFFIDLAIFYIFNARFLSFGAIIGIKDRLKNFLGHTYIY